MSLQLGLGLGVSPPPQAAAASGPVVLFGPDALSDLTAWTERDTLDAAGLSSGAWGVPGAAGIYTASIYNTTASPSAGTQFYIKCTAATNFKSGTNTVLKFSALYDVNTAKDPEADGTPHGYVITFYYGTCTIRERNGGAASTIDTAACSLDANDVVTINVTDNTGSVDIEVFKNDVSVKAITDASPPSSLGTYWGFACTSINATARLKLPEMGTT